MIELFLFENDTHKAMQAQGYGIAHFLVDWEVADKIERQKGYDTDIRPGTLEDLKALSSIQGTSTWCRINRYSPQTATDVEKALMAGAGGIFLPMVISPAEVESFLRCVDRRCATGILIETLEAYASARDLAKLPFERVYFGLNDFAISRGGGSIFRAILDGSVERTREIFAEKTFGFGGVTATDAGFPLPARRLLEEMARLDCHYSFLRRSFHRDTKGQDPRPVVAGIQDFWRQCRTRDADQIRSDRQKLEKLLHELC